MALEAACSEARQHEQMTLSATLRADSLQAQLDKRAAEAAQDKEVLKQIQSERDVLHRKWLDVLGTLCEKEPYRV